MNFQQQSIDIVPETDSSLEFSSPSRTQNSHFGLQQKQIS